MKNIKLSKGLVCILGLFILTACGAQKSTTILQDNMSERSDLGHRDSKQIDFPEDTITKTVTSFAYSTEGAELIGVYSNNGELQYLNVDVLGEMGRKIYEYTFMNDNIIYTDMEIFYAEPFYVSGAETEIKEINYKKYILSDGKMYEVIDDKAMVQVSEELLLETEDIMEDFVRELENCADRI